MVDVESPGQIGRRQLRAQNSLSSLLQNRDRVRFVGYHGPHHRADRSVI